jgi:hypothetical protein
MSLKRHRNGLPSVSSCVEQLESRQLFSATLVEITIPTTIPPVKHVVKHAIKHKAVKLNIVKSTGEQHANIGYEAFAG